MTSILRILFRCIGYLWAGIGIYQVFSAPWGVAGEETYVAVLFVINMLLYVIPGIVVLGIAQLFVEAKTPTSAGKSSSYGRGCSSV
jgi:hypothetical protein